MPRAHDGRFGLDPGAISYDREGFQFDPKNRGKRVSNGGVVDVNTGATIRPPIDLRTGLRVDYRKAVR